MNEVIKVDIDRLVTWRAVELINKGKILEVKTDTLPGYICNPWNKSAVQKIFEIKKRPLSKRLPLFVTLDWKEKLEIGDIIEPYSNLEEELTEKYWPGALTIIKKYQPHTLVLKSGTYEIKRPYLGDPTDTIALRCPNSNPLLEILATCGALAATSANISGETPAGSESLGSTIIQVENEKIEIIRQGDLSF